MEQKPAKSAYTLSKDQYDIVEFICGFLPGNNPHKKYLENKDVNFVKVDPASYLNHLEKAKNAAVAELERKINANKDKVAKEELEKQKNQVNQYFLALRKNLLQMANLTQQARALEDVRSISVSSESAKNTPGDKEIFSTKIQAGEKLKIPYDGKISAVERKSSDKTYCDVWKSEDGNSLSLMNMDRMSGSQRQKAISQFVKVVIASGIGPDNLNVPEVDEKKYNARVFPLSSPHRDCFFALFKEMYRSGLTLDSKTLGKIPEKDRAELQKIREQYLKQKEVAKEYLKSDEPVAALSTMSPKAPDDDEAHVLGITPKNPAI